MAKLVADVEMYNYLDIDPTDDPNGVALAIRDMAEELLETQTAQTFGPSELVDREQLDGNDLHVIYTRRPIQGINKIEFLYLPDVTQELYNNLDILQSVTFRVGSRRVHSRAYKFPCGYNNVLFTYVTTENKPLLAAGAIKDVVAVVFRSRGSEDARSEQKGTFQHSLLRSLDESKVWSQAVELLHIPSIG